MSNRNRPTFDIAGPFYRVVAASGTALPTSSRSCRTDPLYVSALNSTFAMKASAMNSSPSIRLLHIVSLSLLVATGLLAVGCDSSGSNGGSGNPLDGDLSYEVEGSAQVSITEGFFYSTGDGPCQSTQSNISSSLPIEVDLEPEEVGCEGVNPDDFDGVRVTVS